MYKILKITPFGFVFELQNNDCYAPEHPYELYLNGHFYNQYQQNVVSIFDLKSDCDYTVLLKGFDVPICFTIHTEKLNYVLNVRDYNAFGDGTTNDTSAIQAAIYCAPENSVVYIPQGIYLVDQIFLKSHVDIYLEEGAVLRQNPERAQLAVLKGFQKNYTHTQWTMHASWEGNPLDCYCSIIYGKHIHHVHLYGAGEIDGNGEAGGWWVQPKLKKVAYRPKNIFLVACEHVSISGLSSSNSASWNIHPLYCRNISFYHLSVKSHPLSPNTDGLNPESCENVTIVGCHFSVGDDCIAIKSGKYFMSQADYRPTKGVVVRNCYMEKGHGGLVIGSEMSCGVYDVSVSQCYFKQTDRGLRIKTRRGRGGKAIVDGVRFKQVIMDEVRHCFVVNMFYNCDPDGKSDYVKNKSVTIKGADTPSIRNIEVLNTIAKNIPGSAVFIYGLPESRVENIVVKHSQFQFAENRIQEVPAMMDDFEIIEDLGILIKNATHVQLEDNIFTGIYKRILE